MNPHEQKVSEWLDELRTWLKARRGRQSKLARHLGVPRQNVNRWFIERHTAIPAWAAITANIWHQQRRHL
jgi:hypothetical protein